MVIPGEIAKGMSSRAIDTLIGSHIPAASVRRVTIPFDLDGTSGIAT